jgi:hypothetical protein
MDALLAIVAVIFWIVTRSWLLRRRSAALFARHQFDEPSLDAINARLRAFCSCDPPLELIGVRRANIPFRGRIVSVVLGSVAFYRGGPITGFVTWYHRKKLFAVTSPDDGAWMHSNSDVFSPAYEAAGISIFWIKRVAPLLA